MSNKTSDYSVSNRGRVKNDITGRILKRGINSVGRLTVTLRINYMSETRQVSHLVAQEFLLGKEPVRITRVSYHDKNPLNCNLDNLILSSFRIYNEERATIKLNKDGNYRSRVCQF
jgi:hypothetical protein